jgi:hypothetical protein
MAGIEDLGLHNMLRSTNHSSTGEVDAIVQSYIYFHFKVEKENSFCRPLDLVDGSRYDYSLSPTA